MIGEMVDRLFTVIIRSRWFHYSMTTNSYTAIVFSVFFRRDKLKEKERKNDCQGQGKSKKYIEKSNFSQLQNEYRFRNHETHKDKFSLDRPVDRTAPIVTTAPKRCRRKVLYATKTWAGPKFLPPESPHSSLVF